MTSGNVVKWLVKEGQEVAPGDLLAEVETDKATISWENQDEGVVAKLLVPEGAEGVEVGAPVAVLVEESEAVGAFKDYAPGGAAAQPPSEDSSAQPEASQAAAAPAEEAGRPAEANHRMGPAARLLLEQSHLPLSAVRPTGPHNIITKGDVLEAMARAEQGSNQQPQQAQQQPAKGQQQPQQTPAAAAAAAPPAQQPPKPQAARKSPDQQQQPGSRRRGQADYVDLPNSQVRRIIAQRLQESKRTIPHTYTVADVRLDGVAALREALKQQGTKVSVNDCIIKAVAMALVEVPEANARWDPAAEEAAPYQSVDVAVAVATEGGLITPIVKAANTKTVVQISAEVRDLAARARANKLKPEEFQGGSFSISNLGMYGVDSFYAIINPPQACIMAVGGARSVPIMRGGQPASETRMTVSLSADERVYTGEVASRFLEAFKRHMAVPFSF
ncbi:hypothetical protein N2152v2_009503 [Parachlorella kessleri]